MEVKTSPFTYNSLHILERRYLNKDSSGNPAETVEELFTRVAHTMANVELSYGANDEDVKIYEQEFFDLMWNLKFMPNSPTLMNAGLGQGTLSACYVMDIPDSMDQIMNVAHDQAMIEKFGGGIGFSLSAIRPKGHSITSTHGKACGPIHVLKVMSQVGTMITQGGKRDGAHMAILEVWHPDIQEFIHCKNTEGEISNFNISVGSDSIFMDAVQQDKWIHLAWPLDRNVYEAPGTDGEYIKARELFNEIIHGAWMNGEPGMVWLDRINQDNTTPALGQINATNPCGEQPLLSGESCNLGSINLSKFIVAEGDLPTFHENEFARVVSLAVRFLDNVVDANQHPTDFTQNMNRTTRKVGLGIMGFADALVAMGLPYGSSEALKFADRVGELMKEVADEASASIGKEKGNFPAFDESTLNIKNGGKWEHMRNAWRLSIAPTGTISMIANCSSGIEPLFALSYKKHNMSAALEGVELFYINEALQEKLEMSYDDISSYLEQGHSIDGLMDKDLRDLFAVSDEISFDKHVSMQAAFQQYVDSGISKTINLPNEATQYDIGMAYEQAWELGCKGITVYRQGSREREVLVSTESTSPVNEISDVQSYTTWNSESRPNTVPGTTTSVSTGHGKMYVTVNYSHDKLFEVFATVGKAGACEAATTEALCRLTSTALQYGVPLDSIVKQLNGITCCPVWDKGHKINSLADGIGHVLKSSGDVSVHVNGHGDLNTLDPISEAISNSLRCPECSNSTLHQAEGCYSCVECGYSRCG